MSDFLTRRQRSKRMSLIRSRGNIDTELAWAKMLRRFRITGWRRNQSVLGKPDFVFWQVRLAIFVDDCFWHGCPKHSHNPKTNHAFWSNKFSRNKARDRSVTRILRERGWRVLRIWEHEHPAEECGSSARETDLGRILDALEPQSFRSLTLGIFLPVLPVMSPTADGFTEKYHGKKDQHSSQNEPEHYIRPVNFEKSRQSLTDSSCVCAFVHASDSQSDNERAAIIGRGVPCRVDDCPARLPIL